MSIMTFILLGALAAVVASLFFGLFAFLKGGKFSEKYSNDAMRMRVMLQGVALIAFFLMLWFKR